MFKILCHYAVITVHANCNSEIIIGSAHGLHLEKILLTPIDDYFKPAKKFAHLFLLNFIYDTRSTTD